jgi:hypothetical protein
VAVTNSRPRKATREDLEAQRPWWELLGFFHVDNFSYEQINSTSLKLKPSVLQRIMTRK